MHRPHPCRGGVSRRAAQTAKTKGRPVHAFHSDPRSNPHRVRRLGREVEGGVSDDQHRLVRQSLRARPGRAPRPERSANWGPIPHRWRQSSSSRSTEVREEALSSTVHPDSSSTGRLEKSATLCTGPSQVMARSGSRWYAGSVASVLHGGHHAHLQGAGGQQVVELGGRSRDQLRRHAHQSPIDAP